MADQKDERTFITVHDGMPDHPKVESLSDKAFRMLVTFWCWNSRQRTDGFIKAAVWTKKVPKKVRDELTAELVHLPGHDCPRCPEVPVGYVLMHDYLQHQSSAAEIREKQEKKKTAGQLGNHNRWHVATGRYDPDCEICVANGPQPPSQTGSHLRSQDDSQNDRETSPPSPSPSTPLVTSGRGVPGADVHATPRPPERCPKHAERPADGPCGKCGDARRTAEGWDADQERKRELIRTAIDAARADHRQTCHHGTPGGRFLRPDTGKSATCPQCRAETTREAS